MKITQAKRLAAIAYVVRGIEWGLVAAQRAKERTVYVSSSDAERSAWSFQASAFRCAMTCLGGTPSGTMATSLSTVGGLHVLADLADLSPSPESIHTALLRLHAAALSAEESARRA